MPETLILGTPATGSGLVLRCERSLDRFRSTVCRIDKSGTETVLLQSVEGTPEDDFPPSPPLQQMHLQEISGNPVMLAVGMAGRGHWSASIMSSGTGDETTLLFQHAANIRGESGWLGCTWLLAEGLPWIPKPGSTDNANGLAELSTTLGDGARLLIRPHLPTGCTMKLEAMRKSEPDGSRRLVVIPPGGFKTGLATCWDFSICVNAR